jgi:hypothetical protein
LTLLFNFLTALAWIWGAIMFVSFCLNAFNWPEREPKAICHDRMRWALTRGLPAWAWLIARYWM